jgi:hypothetical protein
MADDTTSMQQYMQQLERQHQIEMALNGTISGGLGVATAAAPFVSGGAGVGAMPLLGMLGYASGSKALDEWRAAQRARRGAAMWGNTGLPEGPSPEEWRNKLGE